MGTKLFERYETSGVTSYLPPFSSYLLYSASWRGQMTGNSTCKGYFNGEWPDSHLVYVDVQGHALLTSTDHTTGQTWTLIQGQPSLGGGKSLDETHTYSIYLEFDPGEDTVHCPVCGHTETYSGTCSVYAEAYGPEDVRISEHPQNAVISTRGNASFHADGINIATWNWKLTKNGTETILADGTMSDGTVVSGALTDTLTLSNVSNSMNNVTVKATATGSNASTGDTNEATITMAVEHTIKKMYVGVDNVATEFKVSGSGEVPGIDMNYSVGSMGNAITINPTEVMIGVRSNIDSSGGDGGIAIGYNANAYGRTMAIGCNANSYETYSIAMGLGATANGIYSIAIGNGGNLNFPNAAYTQGNNSIAIGTGAKAINYESVSIGYSAIANAYYGTAIGSHSQANGYIGTAIGTYSNANGSQSTAVDYLANSSGQYSVSMGYFAKALNQGSTAIGYSANASGEQFTRAFGFYANATKEGSTSLGYRATTSGVESTAVGCYANATTDYTIRLGSNSLSTLSCNVQLTVTSDIRDKTDIKPLEKVLDFLSEIETFNYLTELETGTEYCPNIYDDMLRHGHRIYCSFGDDNHNYNGGTVGSFGGFTYIGVHSLTYDNVFNALKNGVFYCSMGPVIKSLTFDSETKEVEIECSKVDRIILIGNNRRFQSIIEDGITSGSFKLTNG